MNTQVKPLTVCFFGSYDRTFTSNIIVQKGLRMEGIRVVEVMHQVGVTDMNKPEHMGIMPLLKRVLKKAGILSEIIKHRRELQESDVLYVGYPGHADVALAWIVAKIFGCKLVFNPLVVFYTGFVDDQGILNADSFMAKVFKWAEGLIYHMCDRVYADTPDQKTHLMRLFHLSDTKIEVLPIGADDEIYTFEGYGNTRDTYFNIMYYGLYSPLHATPVIIEAADRVKHDPAIRFVMVGKGQTYQETVALAQKLKLTNVEFYPDMTEQNATDTLQRADVFLGFIAKHPSVDRIVPNKVYQGMALGKAVVTAEAPAIASILEQKKDVYMIAPNSPKALADAILDLKTHKNLKDSIAKGGREVFLARFTPRAVGDQLHRSFIELCGTPMS